MQQQQHLVHIVLVQQQQQLAPSPHPPQALPMQFAQPKFQNTYITTTIHLQIINNVMQMQNKLQAIL